MKCDNLSYYYYYPYFGEIARVALSAVGQLKGQGMERLQRVAFWGRQTEAKGLNSPENRFMRRAGLTSTPAGRRAGAQDLNYKYPEVVAQ